MPRKGRDVEIKHHTSLTMTLDEVRTLRSDCFTPPSKRAGIPWIEGLTGPRAVLDVVMNISALAGARTQSLLKWRVHEDFCFLYTVSSVTFKIILKTKFKLEYGRPGRQLE
jgi:hypothetical protein